MVPSPTATKISPFQDTPLPDIEKIKYVTSSYFSGFGRGSSILGSATDPTHKDLIPNPRNGQFPEQKEAIKNIQSAGSDMFNAYKEGIYKEINKILAIKSLDDVGNKFADAKDSIQKMKNDKENKPQDVVKML